MPKPLPSNKRSLLYVAKARLRLSDEDFLAILERWGGVSRTRDLNNRGFDAVLVRLHQLGFTSSSRQKTFSAANRMGMASPGQVNKIRDLWHSAVDDPTDRTLDLFLARRFNVAALRFLDSGRAPRVITALKAMVERRRTDGAC